MMIELGAKDKLAFITGKCKMPNSNADDFEKWQRTDTMVTSWLLNSLTKEIVEAFLYVASAKELWDEIKSRYGERNGPLLYEIKREIISFTQNNMCIMIYFTKLKKLWDELNCLKSLPTCTCGATKCINEIDNRDKLIQFLMELNDFYDHIRDQILIMEPLPSINRAYSMFLSVKMQKEVHGGSMGELNAAMAVKIARDTAGKPRKKEFYKKEKDGRFHTHCNNSRHTKEICFKIYEYPEWFTDLKMKKG